MSMSKNGKMAEFGDRDYHNGGYLLVDIEKILLSIDNPYYPDGEIDEMYEDEDGCPYDTAEIFLHGACNLFSVALHDRFGYEIFEIKEGDVTIHWFAQAEYSGKPVYVDIRGATTSFNELMTPFSYSHIENLIIVRKTIALHDCTENYPEIALKFADYIISLLYNWYRL